MVAERGSVLYGTIALCFWFSPCSVFVSLLLYFSNFCFCVGMAREGPTRNRWPGLRGPLVAIWRVRPGIQKVGGRCRIRLGTWALIKPPGDLGFVKNWSAE